VAMGRRRGLISKATDQRVKVTNEALQGVRTLKQYNWESAYEAIIARARQSELAAIWSYNLVGTANSTLMQTAPIIVGVVTLLVYASTGGSFTAARIFSALTVLNQLRFPLMFLPSITQQLSDARVSLKRLDRFMRQTEVERYAVTTSHPASEATALTVARVSHASVALAVGAQATNGAAPAPTIDEATASIPPQYRVPQASTVGLPHEAVGVSATNVTFFHEEPEARRKRLEEVQAEKAAEAAAKAKAAAKAGGGKGAAPPAAAVSPVASSNAVAAVGTAAPGAIAPADAKPPVSPAPASPATATPAAAAAAANPTSPAATAALPPVLTGVNLVVPKGQLYAVVGSVGTGKTSLCLGLLGELHRAEGEVSLPGRVAYVAQVGLTSHMLAHPCIYPPPRPTYPLTHAPAAVRLDPERQREAQHHVCGCHAGSVCRRGRRITRHRCCHCHCGGCGGGWDG